jgi:hypothetical protein
MRYRNDYTWWILVELVAKTIACFSIVFYDEASKQMQVMIGVYLLYAVGLLYFAPYRFPRHHYSDASFTLGKLWICFMSPNYISAGPNSSDGALVLILCFVLYANFVFIFGSSVGSYGQGQAGNPSFDWEFVMGMKGAINSVIPMQNPISDLVPGLYDTLSSEKEDHESNVSGNKMQSDTKAQEQWMSLLRQKEDLMERDVSFLLKNVVPPQLNSSLRTLIESHRSVRRGFVPNSSQNKENLREDIKKQATLINELLSS